MARFLVIIGLLLVVSGAVLLWIWPAAVSEPAELRAPVVAATSETPPLEADAEPLASAPVPIEEREQSTETASRARAAPLFTLAGRVLDQFDAPVDGAFVTVRGPNEAKRRRLKSEVGSKLSDTDGRFRFEGLERGALRLEVHGDKLIEAVELSLAEIDLERELEVRVRIGSELAVRVRWPDGVAADKVYFAVSNGPASRGLSSDAGMHQEDGTHLLRGLTEGSLEVRVRAERDGRSGRAEASLQVPQRDVLELTLEELDLALRGSVLDTDERPIDGARVTLEYEESGTVVERTTDASGAFEFPALPPGRAFVSASSADHVMHPASRPVTIEPGLPPVELTLETVAIVRGQVLDPAGVPVARARVLGAGAPSKRAEDKRAEEWTDESGRFELRAAPGRRLLHALADGFARSPNRRVWLEPGEVLEGIVLQLRSACRVVGQVFDAEGAPAPEAILMAGTNRRKLDANGAFAVDDLPPQPVVFVANDDDGGLAVQEVTPQAGQETRIELRFQPRAPVHLRLSVTDLGRVVDLEATFKTSGFKRSAASEDGHFELDLQTHGHWRGVLRRSSALHDELTAQYLFEITVPDKDSFATELDLEFARNPASQAELEAWLRN